MFLNGEWGRVVSYDPTIGGREGVVKTGADASIPSPAHGDGVGTGHVSMRGLQSTASEVHCSVPVCPLLPPGPTPKVCTCSQGALPPSWLPSTFPLHNSVPESFLPFTSVAQSCTLHECTNKRWACFLKNSYLSSFHTISSLVHSSMRRIESIIRRSRIQLQIQSKFEQIPWIDFTRTFRYLLLDLEQARKGTGIHKRYGKPVNLKSMSGHLHLDAMPSLWRKCS